MKRWDIFDRLSSAAKQQNLRYRLEKTWEADTFFFDDLLKCALNGKPVSVALAVIYTTKIRIDVVGEKQFERLRLNIDTVSLDV